jgi:acyl-CoA reductase-like NAD-dependent aldehyde dehydrogenase
MAKNLYAAAAGVKVPSEFFNYIGGKAVRGDLPPFDVVNPFDGRAFALCPNASAKQLDAAASAAKSALPAWTALGQEKRKALMVRVAERLSSELVYMEIGKVLCMEQARLDPETLIPSVHER